MATAAKHGFEAAKAAVVVSSLTDEPIARSDRVLITAVARAVASPGGHMPMLSEPVTGRLFVAARPGLKLTALSGDGTPLAELPVEYAEGQYKIDLKSDIGTHWFVLGE